MSAVSRVKVDCWRRLQQSKPSQSILPAKRFAISDDRLESNIEPFDLLVFIHMPLTSETVQTNEHRKALNKEVLIDNARLPEVQVRKDSFLDVTYLWSWKHTHC